MRLPIGGGKRDRAGAGPQAPPARAGKGTLAGGRLMKASLLFLLALLIAGIARAPGWVLGLLAALLLGTYLAGLAVAVISARMAGKQALHYFQQVAAGQDPDHHPVTQERRDHAGRAAAEMRAAPRRALKQMGLILIGACAFWGVFIAFVITVTTGSHHSMTGFAVTLAFLVLLIWSVVAVVRMVRADHRHREDLAAPLVAAVETRDEQAPPREATFLRHAVPRWLIAELIPFGCLAIGVLPGTAWHPVAGVFVFAGLFAGAPFTFVYLYKVHGTPAGWVLPIIAAYLGCFIVCGIALGDWQVNSATGRVVVTGTWVTAIAVLMILLAGVVAGSVLAGERWVRRNQLKIAPSKAVSQLLPYGNRGISSWRWLPRQPSAHDDGAAAPAQRTL